MGGLNGNGNIEGMSGSGPTAAKGTPAPTNYTAGGGQSGQAAPIPAAPTAGSAPTGSAPAPTMGGSVTGAVPGLNLPGAPPPEMLVHPSTPLGAVIPPPFTPGAYKYDGQGGK